MVSLLPALSSLSNASAVHAYGATADLVPVVPGEHAALDDTPGMAHSPGASTGIPPHNLRATLADVASNASHPWHWRNSVDDRI